METEIGSNLIGEKKKTVINPQLPQTLRHDLNQVTLKTRLINPKIKIRHQTQIKENQLLKPSLPSPLHGRLL